MIRKVKKGDFGLGKDIVVLAFDEKGKKRKDGRKSFNYYFSKKSKERKIWYWGSLELLVNIRGEKGPYIALLFHLFLLSINTKGRKLIEFLLVVLKGEETVLLVLPLFCPFSSLNIKESIS